jgi:hypothetical protein
MVDRSAFLTFDIDRSTSTILYQHPRTLRELTSLLFMFFTVDIDRYKSKIAPRSVTYHVGAPSQGAAPHSYVTLLLNVHYLSL